MQVVITNSYAATDRPTHERNGRYRFTGSVAGGLHQRLVRCGQTKNKNMICQNCHKRDATLKWIGDGGSLALSHGFASDWCEVCALEAQLKHARERASEIPRMETRLAELLAQAPNDRS